MNATGPPKAKRRRAKTALRKLRLLIAYYLTTFPAILLEKPYWFCESRRSRLADLLENERSTL